MGTTFLDGTKITKVLDAVAAGTTDQNSTGVDTSGFQSSTFIASFGTITANAVTSIYGVHADAMDANNALTTPSNIAGSSISIADNQDNKCLVLEINKAVTKRYVGIVVDRGTANAVIDGVFCFQARADYKPTTQSASVASSKTLISPIDGTP